MHCYPHNTKKYLFQMYEYLQGETLAQWLHRQEKPLKLDDILPICSTNGLGFKCNASAEMLHSGYTAKEYHGFKCRKCHEN